MIPPRQKNRAALAIFLTIGFVVFAIPQSSWASLESAAKSLPIQHNGRIKPFDAFARQTLKTISGSERWEKKNATSNLLDAIAHRRTLSEKVWIRIDYFELKDTLGLSRDRRFFSLDELNGSLEKITSLVQSAKTKRDQDQKPSKLEQKAELLYGQIRTVQGLISAESLTVDPPTGRRSLPVRQAGAGALMVDGGPSWTFSADFEDLATFYSAGDPGFNEKIRTWISKKYAANPPGLSQKKISAEVLYLNLKPFQAAAFAYFLGFFLLMVFKKRSAGQRSAEVLVVGQKLGILSAGVAVFLHTFGIGVRVFVLSRPPVSNMYESMIFMNWALIVFACVFSTIRKNASALKVGALISAVIMLYADLLPIDSSLEVLVPVLRSNYWLSVHVMTVVSSYGAFGLAMALGHRHLFLMSFPSRGGSLPVRQAGASGGNKFTKKAELDSADLIYRVIQLGVILIGTGTFLGGVWANESWGRFWGWDPKETWALITFLGYLALVHLVYTKKISRFGLALFSVLGFLLVLMTWYGVNFVLGRGLHSYGVGSGGMTWVVYYLIFEAVFVGFILIRRSFELSPKVSHPASKHPK